jgi:hypothetical protein
LALTAGWNLAESPGLPVAGYLVGAALGGQLAGMAAATGVVWLTVAVRKVATRRVPGLLAISALMLTLQTALVIATGSTLFFLLQFPLANLALCLLFARTAPTRKPLVAQLAAEVVGLRLPSRRHPGLDRFFQEATWLWAAIFAASTAGLAAALAIAPTSMILLLNAGASTPPRLDPAFPGTNTPGSGTVGRWAVLAAGSGSAVGCPAIEGPRRP